MLLSLVTVISVFQLAIATNLNPPILYSRHAAQEGSLEKRETCEDGSRCLLGSCCGDGCALNCCALDNGGCKPFPSFPPPSSPLLSRLMSDGHLQWAAESPNGASSAGMCLSGVVGISWGRVVSFLLFKLVLTAQGLHGRGDACHGPHALLDCDARGADGCEDYAYEYEDDYDDDGADVYCDFGDEKRDCDCDCHCHCHCNRVKKHDHEGD